MQLLKSYLEAVQLTAAGLRQGKRVLEASLKGIRDTAGAEEQDSSHEEGGPRLIASSLVARHTPATNSQATLTARMGRELEEKLAFTVDKFEE